MSDDVAFCKYGHPMTPDNTVIEKGRSRCRTCKRKGDQARLAKQTLPPMATDDVDAVTPSRARNSFHSSRYDGERDLYVVGLWRYAHEWLSSNNPGGGGVIVEGPNQLRGIDAKDAHFVLLDSYPELPDFWLVQAQLRLLERLGATVEVP